MAKRSQRMTAKRFHEAICDSKSNVIRRAIENGFDFNQHYHGMAALPSAALHAGSKTVQTLLDSGVPVEQRNADDLQLAFAGATALMVTFISVYPKSRAIREVLMNADANPNTCDATGRSPLTCVTKSYSADLMKDCLNIGADPNYRDLRGDTSMLVLEREWITLQAGLDDGNRDYCTNLYHQCKELLISAGAKQLSHQEILAAKFLADHNTEGVIKLVEEGLNANHITGEAGTLIQWAARNSLWDCCIELLNRGADPNATVPFDQIPAVAWAVFYNQPEVVEAFVDNGALLLFDFRGETMGDYLPEASKQRHAMQERLKKISSEKIDPTRRLGLMVEDGNYRAVLARGSRWSVAKSLTNVIEGAEMVSQSDVKASTGGLVVISWTDLNDELDWVSIHQLGKCEVPIFSSEFAAKLSYSGPFETILIEYGDTAGYEAFALFRSGTMAESYELNEGEVSATSILRDESELVPQQLNEILRAYEAFVPCFECIKLKDLRNLGDQYHKHQVVKVS